MIKDLEFKLKHYAEIISKFADGYTIERRLISEFGSPSEWDVVLPLNGEPPVFEPYYEYRIAEKKIQYRLALFDTCGNLYENRIKVAESPVQADVLYNSVGFIRWIGPWTLIKEE